MFYHFSVPNCSDLSTFHNGNIAYSNGSDNKRPFNTTATYTCETGYNLMGNNTRTCQREELWSGEEPECVSE